MTLYRGIDVSRYQGTSLDWSALKRQLGLSFGACKASEGMTWTDSAFPHNWAGMKAAGLVRIAYHFGHPGSDATAQATRFLSLVKPQPGDVLCLDLEQSDGQSPATINAWVRTFATVLRQKAPGCTRVLYVGGYAANSTGANLAPYFHYWWYPRYATNNPVTRWPTSFAPPPPSPITTGWTRPHIWQWAQSLAVPGGPFDANVTELSPDLLAHPPAVDAPGTAAPEPAPEDDDMLSNDAQTWIEGRMDAHDAYVLANLKATIGRQVTAAAAQIGALTSLVGQLAKGGPVDMAAVQAAADTAAKGAVDDLVARLGNATNPTTPGA